ncbi:cellulase family glycosylhydrolase [Rhizobium laguerreae]|uniref:cellulase family glycosylhydrolase n=1 Tax=Rhizobium laguerreae TaxID=1076926 RepID=UPI002484B118|nr:cellulase family glycosylhydrolase [Rhizobium laguerreae]
MAADKTKIDGVQRMVKGSDLLVRTLEELGVKSIYRVPGEENLDMGLRRIRTSGNQFVQSNGAAIRLKSINWFGAEGENYTPHGTWGRSWRGIIDQIKQFGFNCIRLPFSGYVATNNPVPPPSVISASANPDLSGLTALEIFDKIIDHCLASEISGALQAWVRTVHQSVPDTRWRTGKRRGQSWPTAMVTKSTLSARTCIMSRMT